MLILYFFFAVFDFVTVNDYIGLLLSEHGEYCEIICVCFNFLHFLSKSFTFLIAASVLCFNMGCDLLL